jgi:C_GCAxxG_C_C family probable redox protein
LARTSGMCGAVTGAVMAINLLTGRRAPEESVAENYALVRRLLEGFENRFGSTNCRQLIGCDLSTQEGQAFFKANNMRERCMGFTEEATRMALTLLENEP